MKRHFFSQAYSEMLSAADYYDRQLPGLGEDFLSAIDAALRFVADYPQSGRLVGKGCRRYGVTDFSYSLVYYVQDHTISVVAVMHQHSKPDYWNKRI